MLFFLNLDSKAVYDVFICYASAYVFYLSAINNELELGQSHRK